MKTRPRSYDTNETRTLTFWSLTILALAGLIRLTACGDSTEPVPGDTGSIDAYHDVENLPRDTSAGTSAADATSYGHADIPVPVACTCAHPGDMPVGDSVCVRANARCNPEERVKCPYGYVCIKMGYEESACVCGHGRETCGPFCDEPPAVMPLRLDESDAAGE